MGLAFPTPTGKSKNMKVTSKGQVTIPLEYREKFGLLPNTTVEFVPERGGLRIVKSKKPSGKGWAVVQRMRGRLKGRMSTDELMALTRGEP
jgi:AbrB family looped-hinge helix DNA binding protein